MHFGDGAHTPVSCLEGNASCEACISRRLRCLGVLVLFAGATGTKRDTLAGFVKLVSARYSHPINAVINRQE